MAHRPKANDAHLKGRQLARSWNFKKKECPESSGASGAEHQRMNGLKFRLKRQ